MNAEYLKGKTIRLRAVEPGDTDLLFDWENDTRIWKVSNTMVPYSRRQIEEYVMSSQADIYSARQLRLMIAATSGTENETPVGAIDLFDFDPFHQRAGIGILIMEEFRERGFASEALDLLVGYAFGILHLRQLYCNITPENIRSISLFEKKGFTRCAVKKDWVRSSEGWQDEWMFQLINNAGL